MTHKREYIVTMLREYSKAKAQCACLAVRIVELEGLISRRAQALAADAATDSPAPPDGMPRGSGTGNPVERIGIRLADGWEPADLKRQRAEKAQIEARLETLSFKVHYVDAWLSGLTPDERTLITWQLIEGRQWRALIEEWEKRTGEIATKDILKRIKYQALDKIEEIAGETLI